MSLCNSKCKNECPNVPLSQFCKLKFVNAILFTRGALLRRCAPRLSHVPQKSFIYQFIKILYFNKWHIIISKKYRDVDSFISTLKLRAILIICLCFQAIYTHKTWILGNMTMNSHHRSLKVLDFTDIFAIYT